MGNTIALKRAAQQFSFDEWTRMWLKAKTFGDDGVELFDWRLDADGVCKLLNLTGEDKRLGQAIVEIFDVGLGEQSSLWQRVTFASGKRYADGKVSFTELLAALSFLSRDGGDAHDDASLTRRVHFLFQMFDRDRNGQLTIEELRLLLRTVLGLLLAFGGGANFDDKQRALTDGRIMEIDKCATDLLASADVNKDGGVSAAEFLTCARQQSSLLYSLMQQLYDGIGGLGVTTTMKKFIAPTDEKRKRFRILSISGGGLRTIVAVAAICELARRRPDFLDSIDMFAGSDLAALVVAQLVSGADAEYSLRYLEYMLNFLLNSRSAIWENGWDAVLAPLETQGLFGPWKSTRLRDIQKRVLIPTMDLQKRSKTLPYAPTDLDNPDAFWPSVKEDRAKKHIGLKVFHNFERHSVDNKSGAQQPDVVPDDDLNTSLRDAVLAGISVPQIFSPHGTLIASTFTIMNPSMAAVAQAVSPQYGGIPIDTIRLLSIGNGWRPQVVSEVGFNASKASPIFVAKGLSHMYQVGITARPTLQQCSLLLGRHFHAFDFPDEKMSNDPFDNYEPADNETLTELERLGHRHPFIEDTVKWLEEEWF